MKVVEVVERVIQVGGFHEATMIGKFRYQDRILKCWTLLREMTLEPRVMDP